MAGEGRLLQIAREEKNWTHRDAEDVTKISVRYIQALEDENYDILPGATYTKGYLRTYAKHLGLDSDEIAALYNASAVPDSVPVYRPPRPAVKIRPFWLMSLLLGTMAVLAIVFIIVISSRSWVGDEIANPDDLPSLPRMNQGNSLDPSPDNGDLTGVNPDDTPGTPDNSGSAAPDGDGLLPEEIPRDNEGAAGSNGVSSLPAQDGLTAQLAFTQDCWMLIRIDDQPEYQELFRAGTISEIAALARIEFITIGNPPGLIVTLNGKVLPSFAEGGLVVNNVVLTHDNLEN